MVFWLWWGTFVEAVAWLSGSSLRHTYIYAFPLWLGVIAIAGLAIRRSVWLSRSTPFLNLFSAFLLLFPMFAMIENSSSLVQERNPASRRPAIVSPAETLPDIYFIVLDGYGSTRSLRAYWDYDNRTFEDSLRQRGFFVPTRSRANYIHTHLSMASMLNWDHLLDLHKEAGDGRDRSQTYSMIENNRAARYLKSRGFEFVFFPTPFRGTSRNRFADRQIPEPPPVTGKLHYVWLAQTPLTPCIYLACWALGCEARRFPYPPETANDFEVKFRRLARLPGEPRPKFVLVHVLLPHPPYVFEADCTARRATWPASGDPASWPAVRRGYVGQIQCLNSMLLQLIDELLKPTGHPTPIIALQSDHGSGRLQLDPLINKTIPLEELDPGQIDDRTGIFAAYRFPDGGAGLYDLITPVNVFPILFNQLFGDDLPLREDATYWSEYRRSYLFTRLDPEGTP
ncbi:MAG TPA: hypothetical protein VM737_10415 [Gemmatimonadota bacterium]|nr:hypothetical protein [Gemmatimonadota bacterium]